MSYILDGDIVFWHISNHINLLEVRHYQPNYLFELSSNYPGQPYKYIRAFPPEENTISVVMIRYVLPLATIIMMKDVLIGTRGCIDKDQRCFCDKRCHLYGDCCEGVFNHSSKTYRGFLTCYSDTVDVYVVDRCPVLNSKYNYLKGLCEEPKTDLKFSILVTDGEMIFRNLFCALCHLETGEKLSQLNMVMRCKHWERHGWFDTCQLVPSIPIYLKRSCHSDVIENCSLRFDNEAIKKDCLRGPAYYMTNGKDIYRNLACCVCNHDVQYCFNLKTLNLALTSDRKTDDSWRYFHMERRLIAELPLEQSNSSVTPIPGNQSMISDSNDHVEREIPKAEKLVRDIVTILSTVFIFFCIVVYVSHDRLFDYIGKLIVFQCICLTLQSLCNLIIRILKVPSTECLAAAAILHFFSLTVSVAASFIMTGMWMHCRRLKLNDNSDYKGPVKLTTVVSIGLLIPTIVVSSSLSLDRFKTGHKTAPGYGHQSCWMDHFVGAFIWLILPMTVFELISVATLILVFLIMKGMRENEGGYQQEIIQKVESYFALGLNFIIILFIKTFASFLHLLFENTFFGSLLSIIIRSEGVFMALTYGMWRNVRTAITSQHTNPSTKEIHTNVSCKVEPNKVRILLNAK